MRERTTWNRNEIAKRASTMRTADPYAMNQDHVKVQPAADDYITGDPSSFAEDIHPSKGTWEAEYSGGQVKRNEIGMAEMRSDTFNHAEKTASDEAALVKKAELCVKVAGLMLAGKKLSSEKMAALVEDQAVALMHLPEDVLADTHARLANEEQEDKEEDKGQGMQQQASEQQQQQAAQQQQQQAPVGQQQQVSQQQQLQTLAQQLQDGQTEAAQQTIQAMLQQQAGCSAGCHSAGQKSIEATVQGMIQQAVQQIKQAGQQAQDDKQGGQEQKGQEQKQAGQQQDQQGQEQKQAGQQQEQQAGQQQQASQQQQQQAPVGQQQQLPVGQQQQQQQAPVGQQQQQQQVGQQQQQANDALLDQVLMPTAGDPISEVDIELDSAPMDTGEVVMAGEEDAVLRSLFSNEETEQAQQEQQTQEKQASMRTASTRTVGTRPTAGVARIGGGANPSTESPLQNIWQSAPDVRDAFGLK